MINFDKNHLRGDCEAVPSGRLNPCAGCDNLEHLVVFARLPEPGRTKTRLIPAIGADSAMLVYRYLVARTFAQAQQWIGNSNCLATIHFTGGEILDVQAEFGHGFAYCEQMGPSLGERLKTATKSAFDAGAKKVVVIGTDCPSLTANDLKAAFKALDNHSVVLGPAVDGGYYLIGLNGEQPVLFNGVDWSTSLVFEQTFQKAQALNLSVHLLRKLADVDHPEDLLPSRQGTESEQFPIKSKAGRLSVIIPTLNEEMNLQHALDSVGEPRDDLEVIVVDAGSTDQTVEIAKQHGCNVFIGNPGRANQMNAGAAIATGEHLMFLHADTRLPKGYRDEIERVLATRVACGAFPLEIDANGLTLRMIERGVAFRSRILQMPYGDQALFFRSADFYAQNGFKQMSIMEDYELVVRMRRTGSIGLATQPVQTSARRWINRGILRATIINQMCVIAYRLGFSDQTIARLYRGDVQKPS